MLFFGQFAHPRNFTIYAITGGNLIQVLLMLFPVETAFLEGSSLRTPLANLSLAPDGTANMSMSTRPWFI